MLKILWCAKEKWKNTMGGHYFNKNNICTRCEKKYEDLITRDPKADGKIIENE